jgi:hypothetical protein
MSDANDGGAPLITSGAMYSGVPEIERSSASRTPVTRRAMPKSTIFTASTLARR